VFVQNADAKAIPSIVESGESVRVSGAGFVPGSPVTLRFDGVEIRGDVAVGADGTFSVTLPVAHAPGELDVTVEQRDGQRTTVAHAMIDVAGTDQVEKPRAV
jgi:2-polyprenyl-6-methoxyphenol hydroxylase-like FAD-dependent oxidoreductase